MVSVRTAIAGLGFMGSTHIRTLRRLGIEVAGVLGVTHQEGQSAAANFHIEKAYTSFEELAADPGVDVVHICTPNYLHYPMVKAALLAGKHVLCEKPLATTAHDTAELVEIAKDLPLAVAVNYNLRYYPLIQEARARVRDGQLGRIRLIHGGYLQDWLCYETDWNWRLETNQGGELRAVSDIGTHWLDMVTWITGLKPVALIADLATLIPARCKPDSEVSTFVNRLAIKEHTKMVPIQTEDYAAVLIRFEHGVHGVLTLSQASPGRKNYLWWEIDGSQASLHWEQENPNELWVGHRMRPNEVILKDPALMQPGAREYAAFPGGHAEGYPDTFTRLQCDFYRYIQEQDFSRPPLFPSITDGHRALVYCEAILKSYRENCWVNLT